MIWYVILAIAVSLAVRGIADEFWKSKKRSDARDYDTTKW